MDNLWLFADALALYIPSALYVPAAILLLILSAYIIAKLIGNEPNHNLQKTVRMSSSEVKNWHRNEQSGRLQSTYTSPSRLKSS